MPLFYKTPEDKKKFEDELEDFTNKYGKIISTGTQLFRKLKAGKNSSIVKLAKKNIFEFPVFVSSSIPLTYATATSTLLEQMYASFVQMTLSQTPIVNAADIGDNAGGNDPFRRLRSTDVNDFLESYELAFQKDSVHNFIINEQTENTFEFNILSYPDNEASVILEAVEHMNVDPYEHFFQESKANKPKSKDDSKSDKPKPNDVEAAKAEAKKILKEMHNEERAKIKEQNEDNAEERAQASEKRAQAREIRDQQKAGRESLETSIKVNEARFGIPPKMLKEGDINKLNTMKPLMMEAHFGACTKDKDGNITGIEQQSMILGIRSYCRMVNSEELPEMAKYSDSKNILMKHAKYRAGEIKYWRDFKFDIKGKQNDVYENIKSPEKKWYKRLYQMAHMRDDAIAPLVARRGIGGAIQKIDSEANNGMIPNCSLVISQSDVDYIKAITSQNGRQGINLINPSTARKLCSDMFLIALVVIDSDQESVKIFIPDINSDWEVQSIDAINRQIATMNAAGIKSNEIFKALAR